MGAPVHPPIKTDAHSDWTEEEKRMIKAKHHLENQLIRLSKPGLSGLFDNDWRKTRRCEINRQVEEIFSS